MRYLIALLLCGCAAQPTRFVPQLVETPVNKVFKCELKAPTEPLWATKAITSESDIWTQSRAMRAELNQREGYETELKGSCSIKEATP
jgi:hypothetical protein